MSLLNELIVLTCSWGRRLSRASVATVPRMWLRLLKGRIACRVCRTSCRPPMTPNYLVLLTRPTVCCRCPVLPTRMVRPWNRSTGPTLLVSTRSTRRLFRWVKLITTLVRKIRMLLMGGLTSPMNRPAAGAWNRWMRPCGETKWRLIRRTRMCSWKKPANRRWNAKNRLARCRRWCAWQVKGALSL